MRLNVVFEFHADNSRPQPHGMVFKGAARAGVASVFVAQVVGVVAGGAVVTILPIVCGSHPWV